MSPWGVDHIFIPQNTRELRVWPLRILDSEPGAGGTQSSLGVEPFLLIVRTGRIFTARHTRYEGVSPGEYRRILGVSSI
jgi:hypothetical protein